MKRVEPGMSEGQLAAIFEYQCVMAGSERPAYVPVVASGCAKIFLMVALYVADLT